MKFTLRTILLATLLTLIGATVGAFGLSVLHYGRGSANELLEQVLNEKARGIGGQIERLIDTATGQSKLTQNLLETAVIEPADFPRLADYWRGAMEINPELSALSFTREDTGEMIAVQRGPNGLSVREVRRHPGTGKLEPHLSPPDESSRQPRSVEPAPEVPDSRQQPWYQAARRSGQQVWAESRLPLGEAATRVPCVTCATPVFRQGALLGVLTADFAFHQVARYLQRNVDPGGIAFMVELRSDGAWPILADSNTNYLLPGDASSPGDKDRHERAPAAELTDPRIRAFLAHLSRDGEPRSAGVVAFPLEGTRYIGGYRLVKRTEAANWLLCIVLPEVDIMETVWHNKSIMSLIGLAIVFAAALASLLVSRQVAGPLEQLAGEADAIGHFRLEPRPAARSSVREVDRLAGAFEEMKAGLRSFQKYVPSDLVHLLLTSGQEATLGGERRTLTIAFSDIADFTAASEGLDPEQVVEHLREYLSAMSAQILESGGTVDKYIGDAVMAFWGAPAWNPQHALAACTAALRCQARLHQLRQGWQAEGRAPFYTRIGLNTGEVVVGNIGSETRLNYTVIGDAVNLASRLEGLNKHYGTDLLISESTYREVQQAVVARPLDWVSVKGKKEAVRVHELLGLRGEVDRKTEELAELHARALARYRQQDWQGAIEGFRQVLEIRPDDSPAQRMIVRCETYQAMPPGTDWDGVHRMDSK